METPSTTENLTVPSRQPAIIPQPDHARFDAESYKPDPADKSTDGKAYHSETPNYMAPADRPKDRVLDPRPMEPAIVKGEIEAEHKDDDTRNREEALAKRELEVTARENAIKQFVGDGSISPLNDKLVDQQVVATYVIRASDAFKDDGNLPPESVRALACTTIAVLVLRNGFTLVGESVSASPEGYDGKVGRDNAIADAKRELWQMESYLLKSRWSGMVVTPTKENVAAMEKQAKVAPKDDGKYVDQKSKVV